ncbi:hypothetical protein FACS1894123_08010 [Bacteroidia bacterium]|nr:hypothetical protein FACS1894123_08010 [Bacteroidia bacterium]
MNCLLVWDEKTICLLDTGVGSKDLGKLSYYRFHNLKNIVELIRSHGFEPEQITDVVLSHLHFDHCGGCTYTDPSGKMQLTFPNARHWVSKAQWDSYLHPNELEADAFRPQDMMPVAEAGLLYLIDTDSKLSENFQLKLFDGHTAGQIVSVIETRNNETCLFPGDVIPTRAHISDHWISAYDIEPLKSLAAKKQLKKLIGNENVMSVFYHNV